VDDGLATGSTMRAAVEAVRKNEPSRIVVAWHDVPRRSVGTTGIDDYRRACSIPVDLRFFHECRYPDSQSSTRTMIR